jgi:hypothetical protein
MTVPASTATGEAPWWFEDPEVYAKFVEKLKADTAAEAAGTPAATPAAPAAPSVDVGHQDSMTALVHELVTGLVGKSRAPEPAAGAAPSLAAPVVAAAAAAAEPAVSAWERWKRKNQGLE